MTIGERIRFRRERLGMSQNELARKLGYKSRSSINKIEIGLYNLRLSKIKAIADALDTTPSYIMGWESDNDFWMETFRMSVEDIVFAGTQMDDELRHTIDKILPPGNPISLSDACYIADQLGKSLDVMAGLQGKNPAVQEGGKQQDEAATIYGRHPNGKL